MNIDQLRRNLAPHRAVISVRVDIDGEVIESEIENCATVMMSMRGPQGFMPNRCEAISKCVVRGAQWVVARAAAVDKWGPVGDAEIVLDGYALGIRATDGRFWPIVTDRRSWRHAVEKLEQCSHVARSVLATASAPTDATPIPSPRRP